MAFLQPWMLWALPAVLLPLIIHLLNRLRYRTVQWAAMLFLLKANRSATRRAKLRQYLLLACRCLLILFLIWAMARPLAGGWLGAAAGGAPEVVVILLDRSASMEARAGAQPLSKRAHALTLLAQAARSSTSSRFILLENVLRTPLEIAGAETLGSLQMTEPTDTAADLPAMLRAALDYLAKNKVGSAELWIASDLQASNWRLESAEWQDLGARFGGFAQPVRVRVLDLSSPLSRNLSLAIKSAELRVRDASSGAAQLSIGLELKSDGTRSGTIPLLFTREGASSQLDLPSKAAVQRENLRFDLPRVESGWGKLELPADDLLADNAAYFTYAPPIELHAAVIGDGTPAARLRVAAAPDPGRTGRVAELFSTSRAGAVNWEQTALGIWAAPAPAPAVAKSLQAFVESGGVLLCFPPGEADRAANASPLGVSWTDAEIATPDAPFRITAWDDLAGPLARTESGAPLPLARLEILRRQLPVIDESAHVYGTFADGRPFLTGRKVGAGQVLACATLPVAEWSSLGEGFVLLPMVQRLFALGGQRLAPPTMATVGEWNPDDPDEVWSALETGRRRDSRWHAGVYQHGARKLALNRPESEDLPETVPAARLPELFRGAKLTVLRDALELKADRLQSELWPAMLVLTMLFMCAEMLLATSKAMLPQQRAVPRAAARPRPQVEEVAV